MRTLTAPERRRVGIREPYFWGATIALPCAGRQERGSSRGLEISRRGDMTPLWDPWWNRMWDVVAASGLRAVSGALPGIEHELSLENKRNAHQWPLGKLGANVRTRPLFKEKRKRHSKSS
jgi:hypothetical protein